MSRMRTHVNALSESLSVTAISVLVGLRLIVGATIRIVLETVAAVTAFVATRSKKIAAWAARGSGRSVSLIVWAIRVESELSHKSFAAATRKIHKIVDKMQASDDKYKSRPSQGEGLLKTTRSF